MTNKLIKDFYDFIKRPVLAGSIIILPVLGIMAYNLNKSVEHELLNFRYRGMEVKVMNVNYPLTNNMNYILLEDGSRTNSGKVISDSGDTISVNNGDYYINGVEQK
ncbi:hypothetical protein HYT23_00510 [Candidatus Pacearchaeota archaeon]|nr:hypothetical protein [Candidatus Pacearchaeota archaeon]